MSNSLKITLYFVCILTILLKSTYGVYHPSVQPKEMVFLNYFNQNCSDCMEQEFIDRGYFRDTIDDTICVVSKMNYKLKFKNVKFFKVHSNIFEDELDTITRKEMFKLDCVHLLYLGHLELIANPFLLINDDYKRHGMTLFGSIKNGYLLNIRKFKINYVNDWFLLQHFTNSQMIVNLYGNDKLEFCGQALTFDDVLLLKQHDYISESFTTVKKTHYNEIIHNYAECWDSYEIASLQPLSISHTIDQCTNSGNINDLPHFYDYEPREEAVALAKSKLTDYLQIVSDFKLPDMTKLKGIIILTYGQAFEDTLSNIKLFRKTTTHLPIEIFHNNELSNSQIQAFINLNNTKVISLKPILDQFEITSHPSKNYHYKLVALYMTTFQHVLMLDADCIPIRTPDVIFDSKEYKHTGLVMFPDMWKTNPDNPIYAVMNFDCIDELEIESGQLVIDKSKHFHTIYLGLLMMKDQDIWYRWLFGDKDVLKWAARYLDRPMYIERTFMKSIGFTIQGYRCGQSMVHSFKGVLMFYHANLLKSTEKKEKWHFGGFQEYKNLTKLSPRYYILNSWECISFDNGDWIDDLTSVEPFMTEYLAAKGIK